ncbi:MAG: hypothetical protein IT370_25495 [Deltaproteobacteria bacterium]|nr:hypothetical protein [Deltaproteobacteria bacterium]
MNLESIVVYLDQSDLSRLALARAGTAEAAERTRFETLAARGRLRLRVSMVHLFESAPLSFRRLGTIVRFVSHLPHAVLARAPPGEILQSERRGEPPDFRDLPLSDLGFRDWLVCAFGAAWARPRAAAAAFALNQTKMVMRALGAQPVPSKKPPPSTWADAPAHALRAALAQNVERDVRRDARRSDQFDALHIVYGAHADLATVDGHVLDATKEVRRRLGDRIQWHRSGQVGKILDLVEAKGRLHSLSR